MFSIILGQCTRPLKAKLEAHPNWYQVSRDEDSVELLKTINSIVFNFESQNHKCHSIFEAIFFHSHYQAKSVSVEEYHETFNKNVQVIEYYSGSKGLYPETCKVAMEYLGNDIDLATPGQIKRAKKIQKRCILPLILY